jgi:hypothetical protein
MTEYERDDSGKFSKKGKEERILRAIRLTQNTWDTFQERAENEDMTRPDYLEALVNGDVEWESEEKESETELDFDIDEVVEILTEALDLKANAGGKIKTEIRKALKIMGYEVED